MNLKNISRHSPGFLTAGAERGRALSLEYQYAARLQDIAWDYHYPDGQARGAFEYQAVTLGGSHNKNTRDVARYLHKTWDDLVTLNPALGRIDAGKDPASLRHAVFGAASRFNPDDIDFFVELQKRPECSMTALLVYQVPLYKALKRQIDMRTGVRCEWVASPETLVRIFAQVQDRPLLYKKPLLSFESSRINISAEGIAIAQSLIDPVIRKAGLEF